MHLLLYSLITGISILAGSLVLQNMRSSEKGGFPPITPLLPVIIAGAIIGAKIPVILSYGWHKEFLWTGKSYFGALLGAFIALNIYKAVTGEMSKFGDRFVVPLCISGAIGKIGCYLNGCCGGIAISSPLWMDMYPSQTHYPVQLFESAFQFVCGMFFFYLHKNNRIPGAHFSLYMLLYMLFRFLIECIRTEPKVLMGASVYQWMALMFFPLFFVIFLRRSKDAKPISYTY
jgi:phosphatidylglycerol---prolipoprotein diacylglyceryl transferase